MEIVAVAVSLIALIVAGGVGWYSYQVNLRQLKILDRRADLKLKVVVDRLAGVPRLTLRAQNDGTGTARDFYWHLWMPVRFTTQNLVSDKAGPLRWEKEEEIAGVGYRHYQGFHDEPVYPTRSVSVAVVSANGPFQGAAPIGWQFTSEDGTFPPRDKSGEAKPGKLDVEIQDL